MPASLIPAFLVYCFVNSITPGPANLCTLSAALRYGRGPALKQWRGLFTGFFVDSMMAVVLCRLLGAVLSQYVGYLSWLGAAYLLWLAWHMLRAAGGELGESDPAYPSFRTGLTVQLTNVKVILYCISTISVFVLPYTDSIWALLAMGIFLPFTGPIANLVWLFAGVSLKKLFERHRKPVDIAMALSLALCAVSLVWPH